MNIFSASKTQCFISPLYSYLNTNYLSWYTMRTNLHAVLHTTEFKVKSVEVHIGESILSSEIK
jgi:hypothetical protein